MTHRHVSLGVCWELYSKCYTLNETKVTWDQAKINCQNEPGRFTRHFAHTCAITFCSSSAMVFDLVCERPMLYDRTRRPTFLACPTGDKGQAHGGGVVQNLHSIEQY